MIFKIRGNMGKLSAIIVVTVLTAGIFVGGCEKTKRTEQRVQDSIARSVDILKSGLTDKDPGVRSNAVEAVASARYMELMPEVAKLMREDYVIVRFAAIVAAGDMDYSPAREVLQKLVKVDEQNTKIAAAYALTKLGHSGHLDVIRKATQSEDQTVKANAAFLLGKAEDKKSLELLYKIINDGGASYRAQLAAIKGVAMLADEEIFRRLWAKSLSKFADERVVGIEALGELGTVKARDVLITKLDDEVFWVRLVAAEQLGKLGNTEGEQEVLKVLEGQYYGGLDKRELERAKMLACAAIGRLCSEELMEYLPEFLDSDSKNVRIAAARAILQCKRKVGYNSK